MREMITDITTPQFNINNVPAEQRVDCLNQLSDARDNGFITQKELLGIFDEWYIQFKAKSINNGK